MMRFEEVNLFGYNRTVGENHAPIICAIGINMDQPQIVNGVSQFLNEITTPVNLVDNVEENFKLTILNPSNDSTVYAMSSQMDGRFANRATVKLKRMDGQHTGINAKRLEQEVFDY